MFFQNLMLLTETRKKSCLEIQPTPHPPSSEKKKCMENSVSVKLQAVRGEQAQFYFK